eukprot:COSAG04_NODE_466_length_13930_cov_50.807968_14_plen_94_part_00
MVEEVLCPTDLLSLGIRNRRLASAGPYRGEERLVLLRPGDGLDAMEGGLRAGAVCKADGAAAPDRHELLRLAEIERECTSVSPIFIDAQVQKR